MSHLDEMEARAVAAAMSDVFYEVSPDEAAALLDKLRDHGLRVTLREPGET